MSVCHKHPVIALVASGSPSQFLVEPLSWIDNLVHMRLVQLFHSVLKLAGADLLKVCI